MKVAFGWDIAPGEDTTVITLVGNDEVEDFRALLLMAERERRNAAKSAAEDAERRGMMLGLAGARLGHIGEMNQQLRTALLHSQGEKRGKRHRLGVESYP